MNTSGKRSIKIAMALGAIGFTAAWAFFLLSPEYRRASELVHGSALRSVTGEIEFSFPSSFRLTNHRSFVTYYVLGSSRRGFLRVVLEKSESGVQVKSATFDKMPLAIANVGARSEVR